MVGGGTDALPTRDSSPDLLDIDDAYYEYDIDMDDIEFEM